MSLPAVRVASSGRSGASRAWLRRIGSFFRPALHNHRVWFVKGLLAAGGIVLLRLALPWVLKHMAKPLLKGHALEGTGAATAVSQLVVPGMLVLLVFVALGWLDLVSRVQFARFAVEALRQVRTEGVAALQVRSRGRSKRSDGDLIASLVGDTTRLKEGLKGFLIHVATNGMLFAGVVLALLWVSVPLSLVMAAALLGTLACTAWASRLMWRRSRKLRKREGRMANAIFTAVRARRGERQPHGVRPSKGFHTARLTRTQGRTTWAVHVILGAAILACLWLATQGPELTRLDDDQMFVFMAYALTLYHPAVRLARQGTRVGKILACAARVERVLRPKAARNGDRMLPPLRTAIRFHEVLVKDSSKRGKRRRVGRVEIVIRQGTRTALVGAVGAGKSTLLKLLASRRKPRSGQVLWDEIDLAEVPARLRSGRVSWLAARPRWRAAPLRDLLGLDDDGCRSVLRACGVWPALERRGVAPATDLGPEDLSATERRTVAAAAAMLLDGDVLVLDDPVDGLPTAEADARLRVLLAGARAATVLVALERPVALDAFDRVVLLEKGRVRFDGDAARYLVEHHATRTRA